MCMCVGMCMYMCMYAHQSTFVYVSLLRGAISKNTSESSACGCSGRGSKPTRWAWSLVGSSCRSIERHRPDVALARLRDGRWRGHSACGAGPEPTAKGGRCTPQVDHVSTQHPLPLASVQAWPAEQDCPFPIASRRGPAQGASGNFSLQANASAAAARGGRGAPNRRTTSPLSPSLDCYLEIS